MFLKSLTNAAFVKSEFIPHMLVIYKNVDQIKLCFQYLWKLWCLWHRHHIWFLTVNEHIYSQVQKYKLKGTDPTSKRILFTFLAPKRGLSDASAPITHLQSCMVLSTYFSASNTHYFILFYFNLLLAMILNSLNTKTPKHGLTKHEIF